MKYHLEYLIINRGMMLLREWWKSGTQSREPRISRDPFEPPGHSSDSQVPFYPPGPLGTPENFPRTTVITPDVMRKKYFFGNNNKFFYM